jgi:hypothetical protein
MKIYQVGSELFHVDEQTGKETDMTKIPVTMYLFIRQMPIGY